MDNTILLALALGWQGGTVHDVAKETGLTVAQILNTDRNSIKPEHMGTDFSKGRCSVMTCDLKHNQETNFPVNKGNLEYWMGVAQGIYFKIFNLKESIYGVSYDPKERGWI